MLEQCPVKWAEIGIDSEVNVNKNIIILLELSEKTHVFQTRDSLVTKRYKKITKQ